MYCVTYIGIKEVHLLYQTYKPTYQRLPFIGDYTYENIFFFFFATNLVKNAFKCDLDIFKFHKDNLKGIFLTYVSCSFGLDYDIPHGM